MVATFTLNFQQVPGSLGEVADPRIGAGTMQEERGVSFGAIKWENAKKKN